MALLELKLNNKLNTGGDIVTSISLFARGAVVSKLGLHGETMNTYPREFLKINQLNIPLGTTLDAAIKQAMTGFYNGLTALQQSKVTGIALEQI